MRSGLKSKPCLHSFENIPFLRATTDEVLEGDLIFFLPVLLFLFTVFPEVTLLVLEVVWDILRLNVKIK